MAKRLVAHAVPVAVATAIVGVTGLPVSASTAVQDTPYGPWGVARVLPNGTASSVYSTVRTADHIFLAGKFSALVNPQTGATVAANNVAALRPDGTPDPALSIGTDGPVRRLVIGPDGKLYLGGSFKHVTAGGRTMYQPRISRVVTSGNGSLDPGWRPQLSGAPLGYQGRQVPPIVYAIAFGEADPTTGARKVFVGGSFTKAGSGGATVSRVDMAAFDITSGALDLAWNAAADNGASAPNDLHGPSVRDFLVTSDGNLFVAGEFDQIDGSYSRPGVAQVRQSDGTLTPWQPNVNGRQALGTMNDGFQLVLSTYSNRRVLFLASGGVSNNLFALDANNGYRYLQYWSDGDVQTLAVQDGYLYVGGHFLVFYGQQRVHIARLSLANLAVDAWAPSLLPPHKAGAFYGVWTLTPWTDPVTAASYLYVGGAFEQVTSTTATNAPFRKFLWFRSN